MKWRSVSREVALLRKTDMAYLSPVRSALVVEAAPAAMWAVYLLLAAIAAAVAWAATAKVDIVARTNARVVPDGRDQVIASLEGGILRELFVKEGQQVTQGQELVLLDPTRFEAQQAEGQAKRLALRGAAARLDAEASGQALQFPVDVQGSRQVVEGETASFQVRQRGLTEAMESNQRNVAILQKELAVAETMSARGLMSEVEVMRLRRQVNDLQLQVQERINRFRQDASAELVRVRTELAQLNEQMVLRNDALRRTVLKSPIKGVVKTIRANTVGGVVAAGAPIMELIPIGSQVLVEARIRPADIGFVNVGQQAVVKLSSYEYTVYGGLTGTVQWISPDALGDMERPQGSEGTYYRAIIRADSTTLQLGGKRLDVLPGMSGTAEIRTGERSVLDFLMRPMLKSQEAFRER